MHWTPKNPRQKDAKNGSGSPSVLEDDHGSHGSCPLDSRVYRGFRWFLRPWSWPWNPKVCGPQHGWRWFFIIIDVTSQFVCASFFPQLLDIWVHHNLWLSSQFEFRAVGSLDPGDQSTAGAVVQVSGLAGQTPRCGQRAGRGVVEVVERFWWANVDNTMWYDVDNG